MIRPTPIDGAFVVELEPHTDERGFFARTWCRDEFCRAGIETAMVQASISHNRRAGTLRGMHFTWPPSQEGKLVRCERGCVFDVILDLRPDSRAFLTHFSIELDEHRRNALYVPAGVAHGFQTLTDDCDIFYMMTEAYRPELAAGVRHDDAQFGIVWPRAVSTIVDRDRTYPVFDAESHRARYAIASGAAVR